MIQTIEQVRKHLSENLLFLHQRLREGDANAPYIKGQIRAYEMMAKSFGMEVSLRMEVN